MNHARLVIAVVLLSLGCLATVRADDEWKPDEGFRSLFNGRDLTGWCFRPKPKKDDPKPGPVSEDFTGKTETRDGRYIAKDGVFMIKFPDEQDRLTGQIWTVEEFPKDFTLKLEFRASVGADSGIFLRKPQLQCRDYLVAGPYKELKKYKPQDWNEIIVVVKNNVAHCTCNGELLEDALQLPETGPIGLEGDRATLEYRRIQIKTD
ncbi:MAG: DUF1080 domain-containing protein [Phycisphaera sp.]|nr:DUF1080 domain-containing protein [Phycisphaera sp.]